MCQIPTAADLPNCHRKACLHFTDEKTKTKKGELSVPLAAL